jgi:hypothetical protein
MRLSTVLTNTAEIVKFNDNLNFKFINSIYTCGHLNSFEFRLSLKYVFKLKVSYSRVESSTSCRKISLFPLCNLGDLPVEQLA